MTPAITELVPASGVNGNSTISVGSPVGGMHVSAHDNPYHENYEMSHLDNGNGNKKPKIAVTPEKEQARSKIPGSHANKNFNNEDRLV